MKLFIRLVKNLCLGIFSIYSINVLFSALDINIPINSYTILCGSFLGIYGIISLLIMKFII